MDSIILYLLKVAACTSLFYLCYLVLFRKDTFYMRNRIFLILTLLLPVILPVLRIPVAVSIVAPVSQVISPDNIVFSEPAIGTTIPTPVNSFDYNSFLLWIYFTVAGIMLLKGVISLISTFRIIKKGVVRDRQFPRVIISDIPLPPFSFFPYAVIPAEEYKNGNYSDILDHEFAHLRQGHTFDLLLSELFIAFQWFNPFAWLIKRSIILNHEYLADHVSLINNSLKEYQYRLLNFKTGMKDISLAHSFNSLIKNRIIMINKKPTSKFAVVKNILILPIAAVVAYSFATPEYNNVVSSADPLSVYEAPGIIKKEVKGIVIKEDGMPLEGAQIRSTGPMDNASFAITGKDGLFSLSYVQADASLLFSCRGYKDQIIKPEFSIEMKVRMEKDPDYKAPADSNTEAAAAQSQGPVAAIDGVISEKNFFDAERDLGYNMGISKFLSGKEATDKYGEKGANGVLEITTRKKALELGLKPPFPRLAPDDYPTFMNQRFTGFNEWVAGHAEYPAEARSQKMEGWVTVRFMVELDGSVSNPESYPGQADQILVNEVKKVVLSSPKWDAPKNKAVDAPFPSSVTLKFKLPDEISVKEEPFVVAEVMPEYPGGDSELLKFIQENARYPEKAKAEKIEGRVILRIIVNTDGNSEGISILKGVDPLLDAEAMRVCSLLKGFTPGKQNGKAVNVWYMIPVNFVLPKPETAK
ncbi:MAG: TonB family protein [Bacteroidales bacterium]|nr:TonB family protein [Bacteroidales bacterium]